MRLKRTLLALLVATSANYAAASDWPVGTNDVAGTLQNQPVTLSVLSNDTGSNLSISGVNETTVAWGKVSISADQRSLIFTPYQDFIGNDEFWYELKDDEGRTNAAKVVVNVAAGWPVATTDTVETSYDALTKIAVLDNDIGDGLKLIEVNAWSVNQGMAWISADNEITYQQFGEARGDQQDEFWYVFEDQWGRRNSAKVVVSISETQSSPWPVAVAESAIASNGLRVIIPALFNDTGDGLRIEESNEWTQNGGKTRVFGNYIRYTPPVNNYAGDDSFWYKIIDDQGRTNSTKVDVQVTSNPEKSVVEFCGNTYETDGTLANTQLSSLSPEAPVSYPSTEIPDTGVDSELGTINGRRYYTETAGSQQTLMVEVDGVISTISSVESEVLTYAIGTYKGVIYFVQAGRYLLAHDGNTLTELGDVLLDLGPGSYVEDFDDVTHEYLPADPSRYTNTVKREEGKGDAFYFSILNTVVDSRYYVTISRKTYLRISDDMDWRPVTVSATSAGLVGTGGYSQNRVLNNFYYFNGLDYYAYYFTEGYNIQANTFNALQVDNGAVLRQVDGDVDQFIEDRGRLFMITKAFSEPNYNSAYQSKLFVIDNNTDEFLELATCE